MPEHGVTDILWWAQKSNNTARVQIAGAIIPNHTNPGLADSVSIEVTQKDKRTPRRSTLHYFLLGLQEDGYAELLFRP